MSFFGGGTDMPTFFNEHGGAVISTTFDKYCYVNVRHMPPFHPYISELVHNRFERVNNIEDIDPDKSIVLTENVAIKDAFTVSQFVKYLQNASLVEEDDFDIEIYSGLEE